MADFTGIRNKTQNSTTGIVQTVSGTEFDFFVFDLKGFDAWVNQKGFFNSSYVSSPSPGQFTGYTYFFIPDHSDDYYFIFNNTSTANAQFQFNAVWNYRETVTESVPTTSLQTVTKFRDVTKYRDVAKQRLVTKTRPITLYKKVTLIEYFTGY